MKAYWYRFQLKNKRGHASAAFIFVTLLINNLGMGLLMPVFPFYALHFGGDTLTVGLLTTTYAGAQFIGAPIFGALSVHWSWLAFKSHSLATGYWAAGMARFSFWRGRGTR